MEKPLVQIQNVSYKTHTFEGIRDLSLTLNKGDCVALLGKNGTGKTTALNLIAGLLTPTAGQIWVQGFHQSQHPSAFKKAVGFLPEHLPLYPDLTVEEYLKWVSQLRGISKALQTSHREWALDALDLSAHRHRLIGLLSRGIKQRVGIAQAILHRPALLLLDEPTEGLDETYLQQFITFLKHYKENAAILLSTHHVSDVKAVCDRALYFSTEGIALNDTHASLA